MQSRSLAAFAAVACYFVLSQASLAQDASPDGRVITQEIVLNDPTQANGGGWHFNIGAEVWGAYFPSIPFIVLGKPGSASFGGIVEGGDAAISRGNWTLLLGYRPGQFTGNFTSSAGAEKQTSNTTEYEARVRYLLRDSDWLGFTPYLIAGFDHLDWRQHYNLTSDPSLPPQDLGNLESDVQYWNTVEAGFGGMHPFGPGWGMRIDGTLGVGNGHLDGHYLGVFATNKFINNNPWSISGTGLAGNVYLTIYDHITDNLVANIGARFAGESASGPTGSNAPGTTTTFSASWLGAYASLSYSFDTP